MGGWAERCGVLSEWSTDARARAEKRPASFQPVSATHHSITGHVVTIDDDRATAHAHVRAAHWIPDDRADDRSNRWLVVGFYGNEAVRTEHGRRFSRVKLTASHWAS